MPENDLEKTLYFHNPWWAEKKVPAELLPPYQRPILESLKKYLQTTDRIIIIKGPRRTGKTTLLYQIADTLISQGIDPYDLLFLSFDDLRLRDDLEGIFALYEKIRKKVLKKAEIYCFLDEVHFYKNWQFVVKKYFDKKYPLKFIISSSSASLFKKGLESLAGRTVEELILPFNFKEFVCYHAAADKNFLTALAEKNFTPYESQLEILLKKYLFQGGFPHLLTVNDPSLQIKLLREDVIEKVIYRDLVALYGVREPQKLEKFFLYLAQITGQLLNASQVSKNLAISRQYLEKYLDYLKQAYLVFTLKKFSSSAGKGLRSAEKVHLVDPGLANVFSNAGASDFVIESLVARHLFEIYPALCYFRENYEIDFIIQDRKGLLPIEVKNTGLIKEDDFKNLVLFAKKFKIKEGLLICRAPEAEKIIADVKIKIKPLWRWLLSVS